MPDVFTHRQVKVSVWILRCMPISKFRRSEFPDSVTTFRFVQTEPGTHGCYDLCYTYAFLVEFDDARNGKPCKLKYIVRAEVFTDVFAIKFYASRDRKGADNKY